MNLYVTTYGSSYIYRVSPDRKVELVCQDVENEALCLVTNIAFAGTDFDQLIAANLGHTHLSVLDLRMKPALVEPSFRLIPSEAKRAAIEERPMTPDKRLFCTATSWQARKAFCLGNELVRLTTLTGGGHIAEFRFADRTGFPALNPLWVPPWPAIEPYKYREAVHASRYGTLTEGKLLSGIAGHNICLDYFGSPSPEEARHGLSQHGEAPNLRWHKTRVQVNVQSAALTLRVRLAQAGLTFTREIKLRRGESVAYFRETVQNNRGADHFFHWTQHVTLGPPFLSGRDSFVALPGTKGITFPHGPF